MPESNEHNDPTCDPEGTGQPMTVMEWLLNSDPAIRWQVISDLTSEPIDIVTTERAHVAVEGSS